MNVSELVISVAGLSSRAGPLTWSQRGMWEMVGRFQEFGHRINLRVVRPVPSGWTTEQIADRLTEVLTRHESLRTRYVAGEDGPLQIVASSGTLSVSLVDVPGPEEADEAATKTCAALAERPFTEADLPLRVALIRHAGMPIRLVLVCSHLSTDQWSFELLQAFLVGAAEVPTVPATHPLDQVAYETSAKGRRDLDRAVARWQQELSRAVSGTSATGTRPAPSGSRPRLHIARFGSVGALAACRLLAAEHRVSLAQVLLAATACAHAIPRGRRVATLQLATTNRITPADRCEISCRSNTAIAVIDVRRPRFGQILTESAKQSILAMRYGMADPTEVQRVIDDTMRSSGGLIDPSSYFNYHGDFDTSTPDHDAWRRAVLDAGPQDYDLSWENSVDWNITQFYLHAAAFETGLNIELHVDPEFMPDTEVKKFFGRLQRLLLAAARGVDDMDRMILSEQISA
ncbi:condensation domain-containing protein [Sphaerimonospora mesophila]|uniref:condensation domain-containing protein n=1 Tax=Sphaerimonospora mesophila TaxID=37483 RepID=UPI0006E304C7